ncbi:tyrosine-type recombinase/integrase [Haloarchaeobius iranensis]|uniref:Site-specific recombinase XerD n=1 Tax=Haloarchaeobius iranensis TaxID=996166 RepID=A0A1G9YFM4_9EURY|nr:site-specific integrase [Haloarchaeobius iranensis]SDN07355.1 Site-specific recombinase XerD [Haloarchaeobius iranensis]
MSDGLEPLSPGEGVQMYLDHRRGELSERTLQTHYYRLKQFREWLEQEEGIDNLNDLTGRTFHRYKVHRRDERDLAPSTVHGDFDTLSLFVEVLEVFDAVEPGLKEKVLVPTVSKPDTISEEELDADRAETILDYLSQFHYASRDHALLLLIWHVGMRTGGARAIDLSDCHLDDDAPGISIRHRPDQDTPLKNGEAGERDVNISTEVARVLQDYIDNRRIDSTDDYGREPLFTTQYGRLSRGALQVSVYRWTRPCELGGCPHDRDPETCEATKQKAASQCPSTKAPHAVRTGSITHQRNCGVPAEVVSERVNATEDTIERHYDMRTHRDKMESRRQHLEGLE